jgi:hypothetical protein
MLGGAHAANACLPIDGYLAIEEQFAKATTVFVARIERTEEAQMVAHGASETIVEGTFRTIEVLKGQPPKDRKVRSLVYTGNTAALALRLLPPLRQWQQSGLVADGVVRNGQPWGKRAEEHPGGASQVVGFGEIDRADAQFGAVPSEYPTLCERRRASQPPCTFP